MIEYLKTIGLGIVLLIIFVIIGIMLFVASLFGEKVFNDFYDGLLRGLFEKNPLPKYEPKLEQ